MTEALIIIDIRNDYFPDGKLPTDKPMETATQTARLIEKFRQDKKEVVHVMSYVGEELQDKLPFFKEGTYGSEIYEGVKPLASEKVIVKTASNSFWNTDLKEYLVSNNVDTIVVVDMMIHNCVNATIYAGRDEGFNCIMPEKAVNTLDQKLFDKVIPAQQIKEAFLAGIQFYYAKVVKVDDILNNNYYI